MRLVNRFCFAVLAGLALVGSALGARDPGPSAALAERHRRGHRTRAIHPRSRAARHPAPVVRRIGALHVAALRPEGSVARFAQRDRRRARHRAGRARDGPAPARRARSRPPPPPACPYQWQFAAVRADQVPPAVSPAAAAFTIAVVDTGADVSAPDIAAKNPTTYSPRTGTADVRDTTDTARSSRHWPPAP